jgi:hypothetical protein
LLWILSLVFIPKWYSFLFKMFRWPVRANLNPAQVIWRIKFSFHPEKPKSTAKDYVILIWGARFYIVQAEGFLYWEGWSFYIPPRFRKYPLQPC